MKKITTRKTKPHADSTEKSSGKTPGKPKRVAEASRKMAEIPADRGDYEVESTTQGSE